MKYPAPSHPMHRFPEILLLIVGLSLAGCASGPGGERVAAEQETRATAVAAPVVPTASNTESRTAEPIAKRTRSAAKPVIRAQDAAVCKVRPDVVEWVYVRGECRNGYAHGHGAARSVDGKRRYEGLFADGAFHGEGAYDWGTGTRYSGQFRAGRKEGSGTLSYGDGSEYKGEFKDNDYHGKGSYQSTDGAKYTGDFVRGKYHGSGAYVWPNGDSYTGEFASAKMVGRGTYTKSNGDRYEGEFEDDVMRGDGVYFWSNGDTYAGQFDNGKMNGKGTYRSADGAVYVGEFRDNLKDGDGQLITESGKVAQQWYRGVKLSIGGR